MELDEEEKVAVVGVPKEIKVEEYRVGLIPAGAKRLIEHGHKVLVQRGAGVGSGIPDEEYSKMGVEIVDTIEEIYEKADMIIKVKEPIEPEFPLLREGQVLYTYLHLAAAPKLTEVLLEKKVKAIGYETVEREDGSLPLLQPMSEIAGRMAVQVGATTLEKQNGGKGLLLGGVPGVRRGHVVIIGGGTVGMNAAKIAVGMGARVTILEKNIDRMRYLDDVFGGRVVTLYSDVETIRKSVLDADLLIGAVLVPGAAAPRLVSRELVSQMEDGSVIVDVAVDQGGCIETVHPTTHRNPTYVVDGVIHYCVANMPGAVSHTSTFALTNATIDYAVKLADMGFEEAVAKDKALALGVNTYKGKCTHPAVAQSLGYEYVPLEKLL